MRIKKSEYRSRNNEGNEVAHSENAIVDEVLIRHKYITERDSGTAFKTQYGIFIEGFQKMSPIMQDVPRAEAILTAVALFQRQ